MRRTRAGFTLLEILVAIAIFASLALMAQQVTNGVTRVNSAVAGHDQKLNLMQQTMSFLNHDLTQIDVSAGEKPGMVNVQRLEFRRGRCCHPCHSHPLNST